MIRLFTFLFLLPFALEAQFLNFTTQSEINEFGVNNPDITIVEKITISGNDIFDLSGLSNITAIGELHISNTNISNLVGLQNVDQEMSPFNGSNLILRNNPNLKSIESLSNFNFNFVVITDNPNLNICNIPSICNFFKKNYYYYFLRNGANCRNVFKQCNLDCNSTSEFVLIHEGFEKINELHLDQNDIGIDEKEGFEFINSIGEGQFSLKIRNNGPWTMEGPRERYFSIPLDMDYETIDIEFTYQCLGTGFCKVILDDKINGNFSSVDHIWQAEAGDSDTYTVCLKGVKLKIGEFIDFDQINFSAAPIIFPTGSDGNCEFVLDDIKICLSEKLSSDKFENELQVFPNPFSNWINIDFIYKASRIIIYDALGKTVYDNEFKSSLDLSDYPSGVYFLRVMNDQQDHVVKILKI